MTAKISQDCKIGSRGKIMQVISREGEREGVEMRGCDNIRRCCFPLSSHLCVQ